jgi:hypothetical protein
MVSYFGEEMLVTNVFERGKYWDRRSARPDMKTLHKELRIFSNEANIGIEEVQDRM